MSDAFKKFQGGHTVGMTKTGHEDVKSSKSSAMKAGVKKTKKKGK